jgi:cytoskeletal protein CcmA (bactofilin family)
VFLKDTAKVCGNVYAPSVSIIEGACFTGNIDMDGRKATQIAAKADSTAPRPVKTAGSAG